MPSWINSLIGPFAQDLARLWIACDPDLVLLDEGVLSELRGRGFDVMLYEDPFAFRAEYEERYRAAWDRGDTGPAPSLIVHLRSADANALPWDIVHHGRAVQLSLAELFPRLTYSAVQQVEPEHLSTLFHAHETELQSTRGEGESKDFILDHVYQVTPRSIRNPVDFWRELLRMHFANRALPPSFAVHAARIIQGRGLFVEQPVATWLSSKSAVLRVVQAAWYRYLSTLGLKGVRTGEPTPPEYVATVEIPFDHTDLQVLVDSMFLNGTLHPLAVDSMPAGMPSWVKAGVVQNSTALHALVLKGIDGLIDALPDPNASHKDWSEFAKRYGEILARTHGLPAADGNEQLAAISQQSDCVCRPGSRPSITPT